MNWPFFVSHPEVILLGSAIRGIYYSLITRDIE